MTLIDRRLGLEALSLMGVSGSWTRLVLGPATLRRQDADERARNKLARTYAAQVEALKRYRSKGQQIVRVERVNVERGGQAVVGHVQHGGTGDEQG